MYFSLCSGTKKFAFRLVQSGRRHRDDLILRGARGNRSSRRYGKGVVFCTYDQRTFLLFTCGGGDNATHRSLFPFYAH